VFVVVNDQGLIQRTAFSVPPNPKDLKDPLACGSSFRRPQERRTVLGAQGTFRRSLAKPQAESGSLPPTVETVGFPTASSSKENLRAPEKPSGARCCCPTASSSKENLRAPEKPSGARCCCREPLVIVRNIVCLLFRKVRCGIILSVGSPTCTITRRRTLVSSCNFRWRSRFCTVL
jgi:hypothetical protein